MRSGCGGGDASCYAVLNAPNLDHLPVGVGSDGNERAAQPANDGRIARALRVAGYRRNERPSLLRGKGDRACGSGHQRYCTHNYLKQCFVRWFLLNKVGKLAHTVDPGGTGIYQPEDATSSGIFLKR